MLLAHVSLEHVVFVDSVHIIVQRSGPSSCFSGNLKLEGKYFMKETKTPAYLNVVPGGRGRGEGEHVHRRERLGVAVDIAHAHEPVDVVLHEKLGMRLVERAT